VTLETRLLFGDQTTTHVSLFLRKSASASYALDLSTSATIRLSVRTGPSLPELRELVGWSARDAIRREPGAVNQVRVRFEGDRIEVRVNDQYVLAVRDATHRAGTIAVGSHSAVRHGYAIRSIRVHGVHAAAPAAHRSTEAPRATGTVGTRLVQHGAALYFRHADAHNSPASRPSARSRTGACATPRTAPNRPRRCSAMPSIAARRTSGSRTSRPPEPPPTSADLRGRASRLER
jgi:hypothetical protein